jgi:hypothetical protein
MWSPQPVQVISPHSEQSTLRHIYLVYVLKLVSGPAQAARVVTRSFALYNNGRTYIRTRRAGLRPAFFLRKSTRTNLNFKNM